jgi:predicted amidophosphoribosyltransferase
MINISITGTNDPPSFDSYDGGLPPADRKDDRGPIKTDENDTIEIEATDEDGDSLTVALDTPVTGVTVTEVSDGVWEVTFNPVEAQAGTNVTANITIDDGTVKDWIEVTWQVESAIVIPPNKAPSITVTTESGQKIELGKAIVISGTISDPDATDNTADGTLEVLVEVVDPDSTATGVYSTIFSDEITYSDGEWTYTYDTSLLEAAADLAKALGIDMKLEGTYTFYFVAEDDEGARSDPVSVSFEVKDSDKDEDVGWLLGMAFALCLILLLVPLIILILIIVLVLRWRKKKKAEAEAPPMMPPAAPVMCTQCGAEIPAGEPNCTACGAPAPVPEAPVPMACTQCGAEVPPGSEVCPACGAPAPAPAEAAPVETVCECGATIPAGSPTCPACGRPAPAPMPPEGPMACPACGAEIPPGLPTCPACGAAAPEPPEMPPEMPPGEGMAPPEMPPEQPPMEEGAAPPPEGGAEAPAQMVACPTCGAQIAVGATPCPSCGTALNWG